MPGDGKFRTDTDLVSPPLRRLGVVLKLRIWFARLDVRGGRLTVLPCEEGRRLAGVRGVCAVFSIGEVVEEGLEATLLVRWPTLGGCGKDPMLIVLRKVRGTLADAEALGTFGTLEVAACCILDK